MPLIYGTLSFISLAALRIELREILLSLVSGEFDKAQPVLHYSVYIDGAYLYCSLIKHSLSYITVCILMERTCIAV